jgi:N-methylhydantoinase B
MTAQGIYDIHGGGLGAAPYRDGVDSGGHMNIPSGGITDVERVEMQYPLIYFTRNHNMDGSGFGRFRGGLGSFRIFIIYGSKDFSVNYNVYGGLPQGSFGLFGGHPAGSGGLRAIFLTSPDLLDRMRRGDYPTDLDEITTRGWGTLHLPQGAPERVSLPELTLMTDFVAGGGGYGDPLDRPPETVARDVRIGATSVEIARRIYGVIVDEKGFSLKAGETEARRREIRELRLRDGKRLAAPAPQDGKDRPWKRLLRIHESLEIAQDRGESVIRCLRCGYLFCSPKENYKTHALRRSVELSEVALRPLPSGDPYFGHYHEYSCPGCATLLQMDVFCPALGGEEDLWDTRIAVD